MASVNAPVKWTTIPSGETLTAPVDVSGVKRIGLWIPVVTSGQLFLKGSFDTASATFVPLYDPNATPIASRWFANVAAGSVCVVIDWPAAPFRYIKAEMSTTQSAVRSVAVCCKF